MENDWNIIAEFTNGKSMKFNVCTKEEGLKTLENMRDYEKVTLSYDDSAFLINCREVSLASLLKQQGECK